MDGHREVLGSVDSDAGKMSRRARKIALECGAFSLLQML